MIARSGACTSIMHIEYRPLHTLSACSGVACCKGYALMGIQCQARFVEAYSGGGRYSDRVFELNRLCVSEGLPKNALSWFVGQTFKMLPSPLALVSFADSGQNHHGYIYQATNWIYTGLSTRFTDVMVKGFEGMHHSSVEDMVGRCDKSETRLEKRKLLREMFGDENVYTIERSRKHRYFYFIGSKREVAEMRSMLAYKQQPYPKGDNVRYDASYQPVIQLTLF